MSASLFISIIIVLGVMVLLAATASPSKKARRNRSQEDQMASEKPFQMGNDPVTITHKKHFL